jgi:hypothetical protein
VSAPAIRNNLRFFGFDDLLSCSDGQVRPEADGADTFVFKRRHVYFQVAASCRSANHGWKTLMRSLSTWIVLTAALLSACTDAGSIGRKTLKPFTDFDTFTIEQSACLFDCPAFEVKIFSDGRVRHSGPTFEHTGGADESRIDWRGLTQISQALHNASFDEMRDSYQEGADGCENMFTDMSTLSLSMSRGRGYRNKSVALYTGCLGPTVPTERINTLIKDIDQVTGTGALLKRRKQARQSGGGHSRSKNPSSMP